MSIISVPCALGFGSTVAIIEASVCSHLNNEPLVLVCKGGASIAAAIVCYAAVLVASDIEGSQTSQHIDY